MINEDTLKGMENTGILRYLDVSTGHITKEDNELLIKVAENIITGTDLIVDWFTYGFRVQCIPALSDTPDLMKTVLTEAGFSAAFIDLLFAANSMGCVFLNLDADGLQYEGLPTFDW